MNRLAVLEIDLAVEASQEPPAPAPRIRPALYEHGLYCGTVKRRAGQPFHAQRRYEEKWQSQSDKPIPTMKSCLGETTENGVDTFDSKSDSSAFSAMNTYTGTSSP